MDNAEVTPVHPVVRRPVPPASPVLWITMFHQSVLSCTQAELVSTRSMWPMLCTHATLSSSVSTQSSVPKSNPQYPHHHYLFPSELSHRRQLHGRCVVPRLAAQILASSPVESASSPLRAVPNHVARRWPWSCCPPLPCCEPQNCPDPCARGQSSCCGPCCPSPAMIVRPLRNNCCPPPPRIPNNQQCPIPCCNPLPPCCVIVKPCQPRCPPSPCCPPPTLCAPACPQPDPRSAPLLLPNSIDQRISQRVTFINLSAAFSVRCCPKPMVVSFKCPTSVSPMAPREDCPQQVSWPSPPKIDMCCSSNCPPKERDMCFMTVRPMPPSCCPPKGNCGGISGGNGSRQCCKPRWNGSPITKCASQSVDFSVPPLASLSQR
ncbi:hypothetical protein Fcan01_03631 [Folsomia candida]|uniref:Uncharacterized protein n=1 Tax=Folsomia candida TaxID=158441 RepID=A0A226EY15_FOLCA|nr:hypothetical protein Fcan01_03631 [Folsomia candida]